MGGSPFTRGQLHKILTNPIYVGEIHHKGRIAKGLHTGIIDRAIWNRVQAQLVDNLQGYRSRSRVRSPSLLAGLTVDEAGEPLVATHACKGEVRYRYYVSRALQHKSGSDSSGMRIPAREIETAVVERVAEALDDPLALLAGAGIVPAPDKIRTAMVSAEKLAAAMRKKDRQLVRGLVAQVKVAPREVRIELAVDALARNLGLDAPGNNAKVQIISPVRLTRTGLAVPLVHADGRATTCGTPDPALVKLILQARTWWTRLASGETDIATIARTEGINDSWVS